MRSEIRTNQWKRLRRDKSRQAFFEFSRVLQKIFE
jgi:hypothetical protein